MKSLFLVAAIVMATGTLSAQHCCQATDQFAALGQQTDFQGAHQLPAAYKLVNGDGYMDTLPVAEGAGARAYIVPPEKMSNGHYLMVFHEWWGLNDHIKREAEALADSFPGATVVALDLYDGRVATTREGASQLMQSVNNERAQKIIEAAVNYAGDRAQWATIGWCFGGGWSMQAALMLGDKADACVVYYGMPLQDPDKVHQLSAPVLGIFATKDGWINEEVVGKFETAMIAADNTLAVHWYEANHAFANPSNEQFDAAATRDAMQKTIAFLHKYWAP